MQLLDRVRRTIGEHTLAAPETRIVVAVSGGSDSVALAYLMSDLQQAGELRVAGIAHFNHEIREMSARDEALVGRLADSLGWPIVAGREDVKARARRDRRSIEDAARAARHAFFARVRAELNADAVALGHTRDDQAETFLLRLLRGAGPRGLAAMRPRIGFIIRPLIDCRREELRHFLEERQAAYVHDESNEDVSIPRNRVRAELIPLLESRFNPRIVDILADEAALAREQWSWMCDFADRIAVPTPVPGETASWQLDISAVNAAPVAVRQLILWRAMMLAAGERTVTFDHVQAVLRLLERSGDGSVDAPGHRVNRIGARLVLSSRAPGAAGRAAPETGANHFHYPLSIPGEVRLAEAGWVVSAEPFASGGRDVAAGPSIAIVRSDVCRRPLAVRNRRPGDRFRPVGLSGKKKLQDYFVDRKIARNERDRVPLVVDDDDRIVWVAGHSIDDQFRVTDPSQEVLILRLKPVGGPA